MRIIGIDPGYAIVGFGVLDYAGSDFTTLEYGAIYTEAHTAFDKRLLDIYNDLKFILNKYHPDVMSIEKLYSNSNQKTVINVAEARGVITLCAAQEKIKIYEFTPLQVKQAVVGYGRAEKNQVMEMTKNILHLSQIPKPDDAADALALAICCGHASRSIAYRFMENKQ